MSKKTLLNETQVRRFMKLANVGSLSDGFVSGLDEAGYFGESPAEEEELPGDEGPLDVDADLEGDLEGELDIEGEDDLEGDLALDDAAGESSLPPEVVQQVEDALAQALGAMEQELEAAIPELDLSVEREGEGEDLGAEEEIEDVPLEDDVPVDDELGAADELGPEEGGEEELALQEQELVERIARRVALKLQATANKK